MAPARRSGALDGLRGLAALAVVAFHVWLYRPERVPGARQRPLDQLFFELHLGLICFFVLSGFLLYRGLLRRPDVRGYALRRVARIVPAYYVSIALCLVLYAAAGYDDIVPPADRLPLFFAFAQNYSYDTLMEISPVTWTLCVEATFYLALPLIAAVRAPKRAALLLCALIPATLLWNAATYGGAHSEITEKTLPAFAGHFALGMLVALWLEHRRPRLSAPATAALAAAGALTVAASGWWYETPALAPDLRALVLKLPAAAGFALVVAAIAAGRGPAVGWLKLRPLAWTGIVSYGVYLWHLPLILLANHLELLPAALTPRLALIVAASLAAGWLSWVLVERPALGWVARPRRAHALTAALVIALVAAPSAFAAPPPGWNPDVDAARAYAVQRGGDVSFAVRTERRAYGHRRLRNVPSASVLKAMLLVTYLNRREVRHRELRDRDLRLIRPMIRRSDNASASYIRNLVGSRGLRRLARRAGMRDFTPVAHPWGHSLVDAADQARFFLHIDRFVVKRHRARALRLLSRIVPAQRWGVGRVRPPGWDLYFKGGWGSGSGAVDHQAALLKKGRYRVAITVMTTSNGSHAYAKETLKGVFRRLLRGLRRI